MQPEEVGTLPSPQLRLRDEDRDRVKELVVQYLMHAPAHHERDVPSAAEVDRLVQLAHAQPVVAKNLTMRRDLLAFVEHALAASWTASRPRLPAGFGVVIVGAGFCGIGVAVQLQRLGLPYTILERRSEIGGVWSVNRYPDARVDTLSSTYQFGFEKSYPWTEYFARQPEVRTYLEHVATKYGVMGHIRFDHDVISGRFDERTAIWSLRVTTNDGEDIDLTANVVISAAGLFAVPKDFEADGIEDFTGEIAHTTEWAQGGHSAEGKRVAVVGNGSTGVQLLGRVAAAAEHTFVFQRTPQWISPRERYGESVSPEMAWLLETMPYYWNWSRYMSLVPGFDSHNLVMPDPDWIASGGYVNERNDAIHL